MNEEIKKLEKYLPNSLYDLFLKEIEKSNGIAEELHIRRNKNSYCVINMKNIILPFVAKDKEIDETISILTNNSLYAYKEMINNGYILNEYGIRVGVYGTANIENGAIDGVYNIEELNFRIPNDVRICTKEISDKIKFCNKSILIFSPPGIGKTTILRNIAREISGGLNGKRTIIIDTRNELSFSLDEKSLFLGILHKYPKDKGIEIAIKTLNAQAIIIDEIDGNNINSLLTTSYAGVPIVATMHADNFDDIKRKPFLRELLSDKFFSFFVKLKRDENNLTFEIKSIEEL